MAHSHCACISSWFWAYFKKMILYAFILTVECFYSVVFHLCKWVISILIVTLTLPSDKNNFIEAFALIDLILFTAQQSYGWSKSIYTNLKAEWHPLPLTAPASAHVYYLFVLICSPAYTPQRGFEHLPLSHRAISLLSAHRNANLSIYPALPASPLRSLCSPHQCYLALLPTDSRCYFWSP